MSTRHAFMAAIQVGRSCRLLTVTLFFYVNQGVVAAGVDKSNRPRKTLILYQYEACPFCRRVNSNGSLRRSLRYILYNVFCSYQHCFLFCCYSSLRYSVVFSPRGQVREAFSVLALDYITYPCPRITLAAYGVGNTPRHGLYICDQ